MNTAATVFVSVLLASAAGAGTAFALRPNDPAPPPSIDLEAAIGELRATQRALTTRLQELEARPAAVTSAPAQREAAPTVSDAQIAAAVEAWFAQRGGQDVAAAGASAGGKPQFDVDSEFDSLVGSSFWNNSAPWKRAYAAGKLDEVIGKFEALAKANPNDTKVQMDLASAYLAYVQMDPSKYQYSMKADGQFDKVLDLDDHHWGARFSKAVSYTFWPDFLGKKPEAIRHFETLVEQQEQMPVQDDQAQTYLYLGNLLADRDPARAKEVWQKGMQRHPNSNELRQKLGQ